MRGFARLDDSRAFIPEVAIIRAPGEKRFCPVLSMLQSSKIIGDPMDHEPSKRLLQLSGKLPGFNGRRGFFRKEVGGKVLEQGSCSCAQWAQDVFTFNTHGRVVTLGAEFRVTDPTCHASYRLYNDFETDLKRCHILKPINVPGADYANLDRKEEVEWARGTVDHCHMLIPSVRFQSGSQVFAAGFAGELTFAQFLMYYHKGITNAEWDQAEQSWPKPEDVNALFSRDELNLAAGEIVSVDGGEITVKASMSTGMCGSPIISLDNPDLGYGIYCGASHDRNQGISTKDDFFFVNWCTHALSQSLIGMESKRDHVVEYLQDMAGVYAKRAKLLPVEKRNLIDQLLKA